jgi:hypothetical protein
MIDLDTLAVEGEGDEPFRFQWQGEPYTIPLLTQLPWPVVGQITRGQNAVERMRLLLGDEQYERFAAKPCSSAKLRKLFELYMELNGVTEGE